MKRLIPFAILAALAGCDQLPALLGKLPVKLPTIAEACALSGEDRAAAIAVLNTTEANLHLACTLIK